MSSTETQSPYSGGRWSRWFFAISFGVLVATVVVKSYEVRQLKASVKTWRHRAQWPAVGVMFPPLPTTTLGGEVRVIGAHSVKTQIIATLTTSCPFCRASVPQWKRLSELVDTSTAVEMVWLSYSPLDSTLAYVGDYGLPKKQIVMNPDRALVLAARMRGVPLTLVVDTGGVIQHVASGQLTAAQADSVLLAARAPRVSRPSATARPAQPVAFRPETRQPVP